MAEDRIGAQGAIGDGSIPLRNSRWENFSHLYSRYGNLTRAYGEAFRIEDKPEYCAKKGCEIINRPVVAARVRFLMEALSRDRILSEAIGKDNIDARMWQVVERCLQRERVEIPAELKGRKFECCAVCQEGEGPLCEPCQANEALILDWMDFGGIYRFDAKGAIAALVPLGRDRGLYLDRRLVARTDITDPDDLTADALEGVLHELADFLGYAVIPKSNVKEKLRELARKYGFELRAASRKVRSGVQDESSGSVEPKPGTTRLH